MYNTCILELDVVHVMVCDMCCVRGIVTCTQNCHCGVAEQLLYITLQLKMLVCLNVL